MSRRRILAVAAVLAAAAVAILLLSPRPRPAGGAGASAPAAAGPGAAPSAPARLPIRLAPFPAASEDALPATFEGRVVSRGGGAPVPGADLTFSRAGAAASVRADAGGAFRFEAPAEGTWLLAAVTAPGFLPFAPEWGHSPVQLDARRGRHVRGIEIHLVPAVEMVGRAVSFEGKPVAGAEVRLLGTAGEASLVSIPDRFRSDARGEFRFAAPEGAVVEVRKSGLSTGRAEVTALALLNRRLSVVLGPPEGEAEAAPLAISGRVVGPGGDPVAAALVVAEMERFGLAPAAQAASGADGAFSVPGLEPGSYRVEARAEGLAPAVVRHVQAGTADVVLALSAGGRVRGCVRDAASGAPVAPFTVFVFRRLAPPWRPLDRSRSVLDASGCYALDGIRPGAAEVVVSAPGFSPSGELPVEIAAGAEAIAGPDGSFVLAGLPRRCSITVAAEGHHARILGGIEVAPGAQAGPIEVRLHPVAPGEEPRVELPGIGVKVRDQEWADQRYAAAVVEVIPGGGAAEVGLAPGDLVLGIDGQPYDELGSSAIARFRGAVDAIRGPEGTTVLLTVRRGEATFDVRVPRRLVRG